MSVLKGANGNVSSKRVMGILYLVGGIFLVAFKEISNEALKNPEMIAGIFMTGGGLLGLGLVEYFSKIANK